MNEIINKLQFLRPEWFYAFLPLLLFVLFALRRRSTSRSWQSVCDPALLPHVLSDVTLSFSRWPLLLVTLTCSIGIVAMAGPVLHKLPQPVFRETSSLVIALDASQSMDATDVKPSRLERARLKLLDILKMRGAGQTALLVYAADAFTVTPLTDDTATIANLVPALETAIMPAQGSHAEKAIAKAIELLHQSGVNKGDILLMTDGLRASDLDAIKPLPAEGIRLSILGFGTPQGGPIPREGGFLQDRNGAIVIPKLDPDLLQSAARLGGGIYLNMQADDSDSQRLSKLFNSQRARDDTQATDLTADTWREEGPWLLLLVIPLAAFGARRGWLASLVCMILVMQLLPRPVYAASVLDKLKFDSDYLWQRPDQKAAEALKNGDAKTAAELFQQPEWKAAAQYRAGDYDAAAKTLEASKQSDTLYNRGNALAQTRKYKEAIAAYDEALKLNPNNEDAKYNRDQVARAMEQQQQQQNQDNKQQDQSDQKDQKSDQQQRQGSEQHTQQNQQQAEQQQADQQDSKQNQAEQQPSEENNKQSKDEQDQQAPETEKEKDNLRAEQDQDEQKDSEPQDAQEMKQAGDIDHAQASEDDQAAEQWLRRIPDDPGGLLRRKFIYQYGRLPNQVEDEQPW
jgi:Ca-activated chloride channel family protein